MESQSEDRPDGKPLPQLTLKAFSGPLELLLHLIERDKIDIYDIPIKSITDQYLTYLEQARQLDLDIASDFLLMAATLLQLKSRLLLPVDPLPGEDQEDPRQELVLRLLAYRRTRLLADALKTRQETWGLSACRAPEKLHREPNWPQEQSGEKLINYPRFLLAAGRIQQRNETRFNDLRSKLTYILKRERHSFKDVLRYIWERLKRRQQCLFSDLFPASAGKPATVTGFLAILELLKEHQIQADQPEPFAPIEIKAAARQDPDQQDMLLQNLQQDFN
ncbi:MAG: segregation/condensation protein A [Oscillospiraceae bacterium]|nr:segregation/condensation protein A [Oscillospiraceae bacterium]MDD4368624.1 segregation/condensation protein A [Oscillospiraceae bacterium]